MEGSTIIPVLSSTAPRHWWQISYNFASVTSCQMRMTFLWSWKIIPVVMKTYPEILVSWKIICQRKKCITSVEVTYRRCSSPSTRSPLLPFTKCLFTLAAEMWNSGRATLASEFQTSKTRHDTNEMSVIIFIVLATTTIMTFKIRWRMSGVCAGSDEQSSLKKALPAALRVDHPKKFFWIDRSLSGL